MSGGCGLSEVDDDAFECPYCGERKVSTGQVNWHMFIAHPIDTSVDEWGVSLD